MKSVYSAVQTGSLNKAVCALSLKVKLQRPLVAICANYSYINQADIIFGERVGAARGFEWAVTAIGEVTNTELSHI
jgi:hypothetical protein